MTDRSNIPVEQQILVSVIIPVYNVERYLRQCLQSVVHQSYRNIEIIVVDDGSPDRCGEIADQFARKDQRITVVHKANEGYGSAINTGLKMASGIYISIVESDDYIAPNMLALLISRAKSEDGKLYDVIKGSWTAIWPNGQHQPRYLKDAFEGIYEGEYRMRSQNMENLGLMLLPSSIWSAIYRKKFLDVHNICMQEMPGASYQDMAWKFLCYVCADSIYIIDQSVYYYREMALHSSSVKKGNPYAVFSGYKYLKEQLKKRDLFLNHEQIYNFHFIFDCYFHYKRIHKKYRREFLQKCLVVLQNAESLGVLQGKIPFSLQDYTNTEIIPFLQQKLGVSKPSEVIDEAQQEISLKSMFLPQKKSKKERFKQFLRRSPAIWLWRGYKTFVNRPFVRKIQLKALGIQENTWAKPGKYTLMPKVDIPLLRRGRHVLIIAPSTGRYLAPSSHMVQDCEEFRRAGYTVHAVIYGNIDFTGNALRESADYLYGLNDELGCTGRLHYSAAGDLLPDALGIDEWCGDELLQLVATLQFAYRFEICLLHYIFYSRALTILPNSVCKVLQTHARFSGRNSQQLALGIPENSLWFSTTESEEKKALLRADVVLAAQKEERDFFNHLTGDQRSVFSPYIPREKFCTSCRARSPKLRIGYIGGSYRINLLDFQKYFSAWLQDDELVKQSEFILAGEISHIINDELGKQPYFHILGEVAEPSEFYGSIDVAINPAIFVSGVQCKSALAHGVPLLSTEVGMASIPSPHDYHCARSPKELAEYTKRVLHNRNLLEQMAADSREVFRNFATKHQNTMLKAIEHWRKNTNSRE